MSTPLSGSPGRAPAFSRPAWPWSRYSLSRPPSVHSNTGSLSGQRASGSWDAGYKPPSLLLTQQQSQRGNAMRIASNSTAESHRQWSFTGFEWVIRDVAQLRDWVESVDTVQAPDEGTSEAVLTDDSFEVLRESPSIGDDKFKLEIARTILEGERNGPQTLSLYITSMVVDYAQANYEMPASIMAAVKCSDDRLGERGHRPEWIWQIWQQDWSFRQEHEVWDCPLPPLSELLENPRIKDTNSLVICIQIHSPVGPFFPQHPSAYYVPRDLLDGLEASLDNANTGDVRFVCLEKSREPDTPLPSSESLSERSEPPYPHQITARKRYIYAHSDILIRRSEYFATMLTSSFLEAQTSNPGERKLYTVVVDEADFETVYWLLKYCYANWVLFKEHDDPRAAVEGIGTSWNAKWLRLQGDEWDWKTFDKANDEESIMGDSRSITSGGSRRSNDDVIKQSKTLLPSSESTSRDQPSSSRTVASTPKPTNVVNRQATGASTSTSTPRRPSNTTASTSTTTGLSVSTTPGISRSKTVPMPISAAKSSYASSSHYPISPRSQRNHSTPDPHPHPAPTPPPASALSIYQIAHRYSMPSLASLALDHMMSTITPQSSFALLLATNVWEELHILDFVVEKWDEVSVSDEFERCCAEVAAGEWGPEGGKTLMTLFRRLRSPTTVANSGEGFHIPVIDFAKFRAAKSHSEKKATAVEIVTAFKESGFIYLAGHGIPSETIQYVFGKSADFFKLPKSTKSQLAWEDPRSNRGYVAIGRERVTQSADANEIAALRAKAPDFKETMEIGRDWDSVWKNQWPQEADAPQFKRTMLDFYQTCHDLHVLVMRSIALGLELDESYFDSKVNEQCHNLRLLSYPPVRRSVLEQDGQARAGAHSDYGTVTLLFQDSVGGLQVQNPHTKVFHAAPPIPDTIVINVGDLLSRWSNDLLRSTLHRVVAPPAKQINDKETITPARQSVAFFCNPNFSAEISCLPTCEAGKAKYEPINTEKYIVGRLAATYQ
ncbi:hypothetical protein ONZ45_g7234 [Pleurotus djamor]|nr:hypothetical protein ONZ45_g7234 [Pleurotus djamor]